MPVIKSAQKQLRKSIKAREKNRLQKEDAKKLIKTLEKLIAEKKYEEARKMIPQVYSKLDRMVKKNIVHANKSARKKSQLIRSVNQHIKK